MPKPQASHLRRAAALLAAAVAVALLLLIAGGETRSALAITTTVGLDADPTASPANAATSLGSIEACRGNITSGSTFTVDFYVNSVASPGIETFQGDINYNPAKLKVTANSVSMMLAANSGSSVQNITPDSLPDTDGEFTPAGYDFGTVGGHTETGSGVLARVTFQALANGQTPISLTNVLLGDPTLPFPNPISFDYDSTATVQIAIGQACVIDSDGDGVPDTGDNCPSVPNANQADGDSDGVGDVCDNCPAVSNASQANNDGDGLGDICDNCPTVTNANQANSDSDSLGDACDSCPNDGANDADNDGVCVGAGFSLPKVGGNDNCPTVPNSGQQNSDGDPWGDACDGCPSTTTAWSTPLGDDDCDAFPSTAYDPGTKRAAESFLGTNPNAACAADTLPNNEDPDPWPMDNNDDRSAKLGDILAYIPVFGTKNPPPPAGYNPRFDLNADNAIGLSDILMFIPFFNVTCTP